MPETIRADTPQLPAQVFVIMDHELDRNRACHSLDDNNMTEQI